MTLFDRVKFYGFGFVLGILVLSMLLNKKCSNSFGFLNPKKMKMEELQKQIFKIRPLAKCQLVQLKMSDQDLKTVFEKSKINYDRSDMTAKPHGIYVVEGSLADGKKMTCRVIDNDDTSEITDLSVEGIIFNCSPE